MSIATIAELKTYMGITDALQDAKLTQVLAGVEAFVTTQAALVGHQLEKKASITEYQDGEDGERVFTSLRPILSVASVHVSQAATWDATTLLAAQYYRVYKGPGIIRRTDEFTFPDGVQNVRVIYDAGYDPVTADLKLGILSFAAAVAVQAGKDGYESEKLGDYSYAMASLEKMPSIKVLLDPYINKPVVL